MNAYVPTKNIRVRVGFYVPHEVAQPVEPTHEKVKRIKREVADKHGINVRDLEGPSRAIVYSDARQEAMYRIRAETNLSYPRIGQHFGRDHTTVLHGVKMHAERTGKRYPQKTARQGLPLVKVSATLGE